MTDTPKTILQALGVHLEDPLPLFLLAGLAGERKLLLMGPPGQAKTALARALGAALAPGRTRVLDAALTSFDDVRGFVRPGSLEAGRVEVVPGPWSPYDDELLFVDELSRAPVHQQSRWLQLIHDRQVDGLPTRIRWVLAAMNPPSIDGTFPLGLATVDRFHAVLQIDDFAELERATRIRIAAGLVAPADVDTPVGDVLRAWMSRVQRRLDALSCEHTTRLALARIAVAALDAWCGAGAPTRPQGRRAVLLTELALTLLAGLEVEHGDADLARQQLGELLDAWLTAGLYAPGRAADLDEARLRAAHEAAWRAATRAWEEVFDVRGPRARAVAADADHADRRRTLAVLLEAELARPTMDVDTFTRLGLELWRGHHPRLEEGR
ncbi:MAG: AAA family ATPase [Deltaproteobacteria bacterium]|nr:AAA family ATPase [Deltaproteobacteria bacterium]